jgi:hypothetical protein
VKYRNRKQATAYLRDEKGIPCGDLFLAQHASAGTGPQFRYSGRHPVYTEDDLDAWVEARLSAPVRSPSEKASALFNALPDESEDEQQLSPLTRSTRPGRRKRGRPTSTPTETLQERA